MGAQDYGASQNLLYSYKNPANSDLFGKLYQNIKTIGIYEGFGINRISNTLVTVNTGVALITDGSYTVRLSTASVTNQLICSSTLVYIVLRWVYVAAIANYVDFLCVSSPAANDVVIGKLNYSGATLTGIDYSYRTFGNMKDQKVMIDSITNSLYFQSETNFWFTNINGYTIQHVTISQKTLVGALASGTYYVYYNGSTYATTTTVPAGLAFSTTKNGWYDTAGNRILALVTSDGSTITPIQIYLDNFMNPGANGIDTKEFTGIPDSERVKFQIAVTYANPNVVVNVTFIGSNTSFSYYLNNKKYNVSDLTSFTSVSAAAAEGIWFFYINSSNVVTLTQIPWNITDPSVLLWNFQYSANTPSPITWIGEERHTAGRDIYQHKRNHFQGALYRSGFSFSQYNGITSANLATNTDNVFGRAQVQISNGSFFDEDIQNNINHLDSAITSTTASPSNDWNLNVNQVLGFTALNVVNTSSGATWTRSGTAVTVTLANHGLTATGQTITVTVSSDTGAIPLGAKTITYINSSTFSFTGVNTGASSGTLTFTITASTTQVVFATTHTLVAGQAISIMTGNIASIRGVTTITIGGTGTTFTTGVVGSATTGDAVVVGARIPIYYINSLSGSNYIWRKLNTSDFLGALSLPTTSWARSGVTITVTLTSHGLITGDTINIPVTSDANAIPLGIYAITFLTANTFSFTGINTGGASGTITYISAYNASTIATIGAQFNNVAGGGFSAITSTRYYPVYLAATNTTSEPVIAILGQGQSTNATLVTALGEAAFQFSSLVGLSNINIQEIVPFYRLTFQYSTAAGFNTSRIRLVDATFLNIRLATLSGVVAGGGTTSLPAAAIVVDTSNFSQILTTAETNAQVALEKIDSTIKSWRNLLINGNLKVWQWGTSIGNSTIGASVTVTGASHLYTRGSGSFITDGFLPGQTVAITGFSNGGNNGTFTIASVTTLTLVMTTGSQINETSTSTYISVTPRFIADKWLLDDASSVPFTGSQQATATSGLSQYGLRIQKSNGSATNGVLRISQSIESVDIIPMQGQVLVLTFWAKCGANFSAASSNLIVKINTGTGTDERLIIPYTGNADLLSSTATLTTSYQKFTFVTPAIGATVTELGLALSYTTVGTAGAADWFEISQIQINTGSIIPFISEALEDTLKRCLRTHYRSVSGGQNFATLAVALSALSATRAFGPAKLVTKMRITPSLIAVGSLACMKADGSQLAITTITTNTGFSSPEYLLIDLTCATGLVVGAPAVITCNNDQTAFLDFNCEI